MLQLFVQASTCFSFSILMVDSFLPVPILQTLDEMKSQLETQLSFPIDIKIVRKWY